MATVRSARPGHPGRRATPSEREQIIEMLKKAYWMEIETVMSYIANSINPDGVRAQEIIESLQHGHPGGARPRAAVRGADQGALRRRPRLAGLHGRAVLPAAARAPDRHRPRHQGRDRGRDRRDRALQPHHRGDRRVDPVTNDMVIAILRDEEGHRRLFEGFLREYEAEGLA